MRRVKQRAKRQVKKSKQMPWERTVESEDFGGRGSGTKPYEWLKRVETREETRARKQHRKLPPLPYLAAPQEFHKRRLAGGRPAREKQKHVDVEKRLRKALAEDKQRVELRPGDVKTLVELYDRIAWRSNPSVMIARAATRGVIGRLEAWEEELEPGSKVARILREIVEQAKETLGAVEEDDEDEGGADA